MALPVDEQTLGMFVAHLDTKGFSPSTIWSHMSAIGFFHKFKGHADPTRSFLVQRALIGLRNKACADCRLPLSSSMIYALVGVLPQMNISLYERTLFGAAFHLAFTAFLRIGEIFPRSGANAARVLQISDLVIGPDTTTLVFRHFKHGAKQGVQKFCFKPSGHPATCGALRDYLALRGSTDGPLFRRGDGKPLLRSRFQRILNTCLNGCNLDPARYKGHSFRIGRATECAAMGMSDAQIRNLGRWASDAFRKYIRVTSA